MIQGFSKLNGRCQKNTGLIMGTKKRRTERGRERERIRYGRFIQRERERSNSKIDFPRIVI